MKNKTYFLLILIFTITNIFAKDTPFTSSVSLVSMGMDYVEYDQNGNILDSENSSYLELGGVEVSLGYTIEKDLSSSSEIIFNWMILSGETTYKGSYVDSELGYGSVVSSTLNTISDIDISYKQSKILNSAIEISYGIGLGHRYWERVLSKSQVEIYTWYSIRPMFGISTNNEKLNLGMFIEYQYGFDTKMSAPNHTFTLGGADILEISFPVHYNYNQDVDFFFEATVQKQMIGKSDRLYTGNGDKYWYEPESTAYNSYLKVGIEYDF